MATDASRTAELVAYARECAPNTDLFELLDVDATSTKDEIHRAWRRKGLKYHPDKAGANFDAAKYESFERARDVLTDPAAREAYDRARAAALQSKRRLDDMSAERRRFAEELEAAERAGRRAAGGEGVGPVEVDDDAPKLTPAERAERERARQEGLRKFEERKRALREAEERDRAREAEKWAKDDARIAEIEQRLKERAEKRAAKSSKRSRPEDDAERHPADAAAPARPPPPGPSSSPPPTSDHAPSSSKIRPAGSAAAFIPVSNDASSASSGAPKPIHRRKRTTTSCTECRRRMLKCNGSAPCTYCMLSSRECLYLVPKPDEARQPRPTETKGNAGPPAQQQLERCVAKSTSPGTSPTLEPADAPPWQLLAHARAAHQRTTAEITAAQALSKGALELARSTLEKLEADGNRRALLPPELVLAAETQQWQDAAQSVRVAADKADRSLLAAVKAAQPDMDARNGGNDESVDARWDRRWSRTRAMATARQTARDAVAAGSAAARSAGAVTAAARMANAKAGAAVPPEEELKAALESWAEACEAWTSAVAKTAASAAAAEKSLVEFMELNGLQGPDNP